MPTRPSNSSDQPTLFASDASAPEWDQSLINAYLRQDRTLDDLPYTAEFDAMYAALGGEQSGRSRWDVLHRLQNLRKANKLPKLGKAATPAVKVTEGEEQILATLVEAAAGSLGQRDRLLYTPAFADIVTTFNARTARNLTPHDAWRLIAKLAK